MQAHRNLIGFRGDFIAKSNRPCSVFALTTDCSQHRLELVAGQRPLVHQRSTSQRSRLLDGASITSSSDESFAELP
jgi:hypothetical protein